jgi:predicted 3-demethylubiquinone-9 3-methyltransferase (glyoxalase superfamily)
VAEAMPFLTFQPSRGPTATEAMALYTGLFDDGAVVSEQRRPDDAPMGAGTVEVAEIVVAGLHVRCSDSHVEHAWDFTPAVALWVTCGSADEHRRLVDGLSEGGAVFMPLDDYGFGPFAWVQDRFGVSWQLAGPAGR